MENTNNMKNNNMKKNIKSKKQNNGNKEKIVSIIAICAIFAIIIILAVVNNNMNKAKTNENVQAKTTANTGKTLSKEEQEKVEKANEEIEITPDILKQKLENNENMIIDFHATWCEPCKLMKPEIAKALEQGVKIYKIDIDKYRETAVEYGVRVMPTLVAIKNKKPAKTVYGYQTVDKIQALYNTIK